MSDAQPALVGPDGREIRSRPKLTACPQCRAPKDKRINTSGFGPPAICCGKCGHAFPGETEP